MIAYVLLLVGFLQQAQAPVVQATPYPTRSGCERALVDLMHQLSATAISGEGRPVAVCVKIERPLPL